MLQPPGFTLISSNIAVGAHVQYVNMRLFNTLPCSCWYFVFTLVVFSSFPLLVLCHLFMLLAGDADAPLQPENILYNDQWVLKIADFGVSINLNDERAVTRAGTVDYMVRMRAVAP